MTTVNPRPVNSPLAQVQLTQDAVEDLHYLSQKDPEILRRVFKKLLDIEKSPKQIGKPLRGDLSGFRSLRVGDRVWRIVWRVIEPESGPITVEVTEVWCVGAREDGEVYRQLALRIATIGKTPQTLPLIALFEEVVEKMGLQRSRPESSLPQWLQEGLRSFGVEDEEIRNLDEDAAQALMIRFWSKQP